MTTSTEKLMWWGSLCLLVGVPVGVIIGILVSVRLLSQSFLFVIFPCFIAGLLFLFMAFRLYAKDTKSDLFMFGARSTGTALLFLCTVAALKASTRWMPEIVLFGLLELIMVGIVVVGGVYVIQIFLSLSRVFSQLAVERENESFNKGQRFLELCVTLYVAWLIMGFIALLAGFIHMFLMYILVGIMAVIGAAIVILFWLAWFLCWRDFNRSLYFSMFQVKEIKNLVSREDSKPTAGQEESS